MVKPDDVRKTLSQAAPAPAGVTHPQPKPAASPAAPKAPAKPTASQGSTRAAQAATQNAQKITPKVPAVRTPPVSASAQKNAGNAKSSATSQKAESPKAGGAELKPAADHETGPRRDPFDPLVGKEKAGPAPQNLPPGKAGLQIATLRLDGIVRGPNGMIAVVSNPQQRVYFLRDGDHLYDGDVEHITLEGLSFHQTGTDPFGKPVEREVTKRLYPTPGDEK
jgi:type IV pilus assembly protein PilP